MATMRQTGSRRLALEDVVAVGRPAVYRRFGDELLFLEGRIFDVSVPGSPAEVTFESPASHPHIARLAVGIEFGWQHALHCSCPVCSSQAAPTGVTKAAAARAADYEPAVDPQAQPGPQPARLRAGYRALHGETGQGPSA
jgi:hypothetical protein